MWLCVAFNCDCVPERYCSAVRAPTLVLTLNDMGFSVLVWTAGLRPRAFCPEASKATAVPNGFRKFVTFDYEPEAEKSSDLNFRSIVAIRHFMPATGKFLPGGPADFACQR